MKKIYLIYLPAFLLLISACKKDKSTPPIENLLTSKNWTLFDYYAPNYINFSPHFEGTLSFKRGGQAGYTDTIGQLYSGTWEHIYHDDTEKHSLYIKLVNPATQDEIIEYYDHIEFLDDRHFTAYVYAGFSENYFQFQEKR
ncbi:hypothetical protein A4H97_27485 [Niastella yeongjuensis]|uniref:Lipocalin-like domain-containing protein n=1 Tax=Niastella yeongjuensis TaxID=354355 RepID=A0A1V9EYT2_9BACT|nr:hypothetical protein [Niastella yeongjuensis]OQP51323.1 hypothetical protein A4H97_27485 [Niastella yeongjuensis]SEP38863.1 hypothetical protein SAMN05660816_05657 [Niastella yeongjuensis]